jgi:chemotaxis protein CheX
MEKYVSLLSKQCVSVFYDLGKLMICAGKSFIPDELVDGQTAGEEVSAIMGLAGSSRGLVWLSMKQSVAFKLVDALAGGTHTALDQQVIDVLGEVANIVAGRVKLIFQNEYRFELSLPVVIQGVVAALPSGQGSAGNLASAPRKRISIPFTIFEGESFTLSVSIQGA